MDEQQTVLVIGGPTASGKSGLALSVAKAAGGIVINADSVQLYDGLGTLTAQPSPEDKAQAPHRLYACLKPQDACTAAAWRTMALEEIAAAKKSGALPVIVGGTGFYIKALLEGLSPLPAVPQDVRAATVAHAQKIGHAAFFAELQALDPATSAKLDPANPQRALRAREVLEATGRGLAQWQAQPRQTPPAHLRFVTVALLPPRDVLYARCNARFAQMLKAGALDDVRAFDALRETLHVPDTAPLLKALGYAELSATTRGEMTLDAATQKACATTRHYAKRQTTWFRNQWAPNIVLETSAPEAVLKLL